MILFVDQEFIARPSNYAAETFAYDPGKKAVEKAQETVRFVNFLAALDDSVIVLTFVCVVIFEVRPRANQI